LSGRVQMLGYGGWWGQVGAQSQARQAAGDVEGCSEAGQAQSAADSHDLSGRLAGRAAESGYAAQNRRAGMLSGLQRLLKPVFL